MKEIVKRPKLEQIGSLVLSWHERSSDICCKLEGTEFRIWENKHFYDQNGEKPAYILVMIWYTGDYKPLALFDKIEAAQYWFENNYLCYDYRVPEKDTNGGKFIPPPVDPDYQRFLDSI